MVTQFLFSQTENFQNKRNVLKGSSKFRTGKSKRKGSYHQLLSHICDHSAKLQVARVNFEKNGAPQISFKIPIQSFCLPFALTVNQPVSPCTW